MERLPRVSVKIEVRYVSFKFTIDNKITDFEFLDYIHMNVIGRKKS